MKIDNERGATIEEAAFWLDRLAQTIHRLNSTWWQVDENGRYTRNKAEAIALMHSELSEMLEGVRKDKMDDHLPHLLSEEVEAADVLIRLLDYCAGFRLDIADAMVQKLHYNAKRSDHKLQNRNAAGGKKF